MEPAASWSSSSSVDGDRDDVGPSIWGKLVLLGLTWLPFLFWWALSAVLFSLSSLFLLLLLLLLTETFLWSVVVVLFPSKLSTELDPTLVQLVDDTIRCKQLSLFAPFTPLFVVVVLFLCFSITVSAGPWCFPLTAPPPAAWLRRFFVKNNVAGVSPVLEEDVMAAATWQLFSDLAVTNTEEPLTFFDDGYSLDIFVRLEWLWAVFFWILWLLPEDWVPFRLDAPLLRPSMSSRDFALKSRRSLTLGKFQHNPPPVPLFCPSFLAAACSGWKTKKSQDVIFRI